MLQDSRFPCRRPREGRARLQAARVQLHGSDRRARFRSRERSPTSRRLPGRTRCPPGVRPGSHWPWAPLAPDR